jgi:prophage regulatory protein
MEKYIVKILRMPQVIEKTGLSRSTIYVLIGRSEFVPVIKLSERAIGFDCDSIDQWLEGKIPISQRSTEGTEP